MIKFENIIKSAGLLILYNNTILLEHPTGQPWFGSYSIPKGHIEKGETIMDAAIRETYEEVGLNFNKEDIESNTLEFISYENKEGDIYKRVYFYRIELSKEIKIDKTKLDKKETDWAGFLTKSEAEKRIFWRFKPMLKYIK